MTQMYYEENPESQHDYHDLSVTLLGETFQFTTDSGVFSKKMIDFGSQVLLGTLDFEKGSTVLDLGCGYGPLGIALAKVQGVKATLVDVNKRALELAKKNALINHVDVAVFQSSVYENITEKFDHIISNPPIRAGKDVVHKILEEAFDHLNPKGDLTVVIQKKQGAPSAKARMQAVFGNVETVKKDKGYYILRSTKS